MKTNMTIISWQSNHRPDVLLVLIYGSFRTLLILIAERDNEVDVYNHVYFL